MSRPTAATVDLLAPEARTDYRALETNRNTLGSWDLQYQTGPRAGAHFEPVVRIVSVARWVPDPKNKRVKPKGNELLITLEGKHGVLPKKWIVRPDTKKSIAKAVRSTVVQDWVGKQIQIFFDPSIRFGTEKTGGIRAKAAPGQAPAELTEEPLDNEPDERALAAIEEGMRQAFGEEDG